jgi:phosphodiesterase/alkaline phosphatase D-like protein
MVSAIAGALGIAATTVPGIEEFLVDEAQAQTVLDVRFTERPKAGDWSLGSTRFLTRFPDWVWVAGHAGVIELPETLASAGENQPAPAFLLDHDTAAPAQTLIFRVSGGKTKPGVVIGATDLFTYHTVTVEDGWLVFSSYQHNRRIVLHRADCLSLTKGHTYELEVGVAAGRVKARVGISGKLPSHWQLDCAITATRGMPGVLLVGEPAMPTTRISVLRYELRSTVDPAKTPIRAAYLLAGAPDGTGHTAVRVGAERGCDVTVQWSSDSSFSSPQSSATLDASAWPHTVRTSVPTSSKVWWRALLHDTRSGVKATTAAQAITPPDPSLPLVMGAASCAQLWDADAYLGLKRLGAAAEPHQPTILVYQGDFGYPSNSYASCLRPQEDFYQDRITRFLSDPHFVALRSRTPTAFTMDDHEYGPENNCNKNTLFPWTIALWNKMHADPANVGYFDWRYGDVHCLTLDGRRYSDPPSDPESPTKTKLGDTQKAWMKQTISNSSASLFVVFSADIFASRGNQAPQLDCWWYGWTTEYAELMSFFHGVQLAGKRVVILSGDAHSMRIHNHPDPQSRSGATPVVEFICAGLRARSWSMEHDPDPTLDPTRRVKGKSGLGMIAVDPQGSANRTITLRAVSGQSGPLDLFPALDLPFAP